MEIEERMSGRQCDRQAQGCEMKKKKFLGMLTAAALCLGLTGCGENQIPELTDAQVREMGQYVAFILMKYNANGGSRLVELSDYMQNPPAAEQPGETEQPEDSAGMGPVDDTPVVDAPGQTVQEYTLEEVMGLPEGITVGYAGEEICSVYPSEGEENYFVMTATEGRQLLVLKFFLVNGSGQDQTVDLISRGQQEDLIFQITVNGDYRRRALNTTLLDDLATLKCDIPAGGTYNAVLLIEVDQGLADGVETIDLSAKYGDKACSVQVR